MPLDRENGFLALCRNDGQLDLALSNEEHGVHRLGLREHRLTIGNLGRPRTVRGSVGYASC